MIPPEKLLQYYIAMKLHFTSEKYDAIEYKCRVRNIYNTSHVEKRHDGSLIYALAKKFDSQAEAASFMAANLAYGNGYPFDDHDKAFALYTKWKRIRQSITKVFRDDLDTIASYGVSYKELIDANDTKLFFLAKSGKITIETIAILNKYDKFIDSWKIPQSIWKGEYLRISKLENFVKFDPAKIEPLILTFKEELGTENAQV